VAGLAVDLKAALVDHHLMMEPAESDQVVGVGGSALAPGLDVVDLEPMPRVASIGATAVPVTVEDGSA
jgi:hypothetical protein